MKDLAAQVFLEKNSEVNLLHYRMMTFKHHQHIFLQNTIKRISKPFFNRNYYYLVH